MSGNTNANQIDSPNNFVIDFSSLSDRARAALPKPFFDIRDYGAAVDGVTDDTPAVEAAKAAALAAAGGIIYFPPGITRLKSNGTSLGNINIQGSYIFQGEGSRSIIKFSDITNTSAFFCGNVSSVTVRDLFFVGLDNGAGGSDPNPEGSGSALINLSATWLTLVENCFFLGLGNASGAGVLLLGGRQAWVRNCFFGGCATPNGGVLSTYQLSSLRLDKVTFLDYHTFNNVSYTKSTVYGLSKYWINADSFNAIQTPGGSCIVALFDCDFDEASTVAPVYIHGGADRAAHLERVSFNGAVGGLLPALKVSTLNKLTVRNMWAGWNIGAWSSVQVTDVNQVDINGLINDAGATNVELLGTTKRLRLRNSQDVTILNTAGAFIDADQTMPTTASAAALAPKGKITHVTGTNNITSITTTNLRVGDVIKLIFDGVLTVTDGGNLRLAGNFVTAANSVLELLYDGSNMIEVSRSSN